jgi:hypothetical protein
MPAPVIRLFDSDPKISAYLTAHSTHVRPFPFGARFPVVKEEETT